MARYLIRFVKSFVFLTLWLVIILGLMLAFKQTTMSLSDLFTTDNGRMFWLMVAVFSLVHPVLGYSKRPLLDEAKNISAEIDEVAAKSGYHKVSEENGEMVYRADSFLKALMLQYEDKITIKTVDGTSTIEGPRKEIVKMIFRLDTLMISKENDKNNI